MRSNDPSRQMPFRQGNSELSVLIRTCLGNRGGAELKPLAPTLFPANIASKPVNLPQAGFFLSWVSGARPTDTPIFSVHLLPGLLLAASSIDIQTNPVTLERSH